MTDVRVPVGACRCPGSPHEDGDWVELRPDPTIDMGAAVYAAVSNVGDDASLMQVELTRAYLRYGIVRWSFVDTRGDAIPIRPRAADFADTISDLLPFSAGGFDVADRADDLYTKEVLRPLMTRLSSTRSRGGQTAGSTSPNRTTSPTPRRRSRPSSRVAMDGKPSAAPDS